MSLRDGFQDWLLPELKAFRSQKDRNRAFGKCSTLFSKEGWLFWILLVGGASIWAVIWRHSIALPLAEYLILAGVPKLIGVMILVLSVMLVTFGIVVAVFCREASAIRKRLRKLMAEEEIFPCISCYYNLKGNVSGVCPECGEKI